MAFTIGPKLIIQKFTGEEFENPYVLDRNKLKEALNKSNYKLSKGKQLKKQPGKKTK